MQRTDLSDAVAVNLICDGSAIRPAPAPERCTADGPLPTRWRPTPIAVGGLVLVDVSSDDWQALPLREIAAATTSATARFHGL